MPLPSSAARRLGRVALWLLTLPAAFVVVEGSASVLLFARDMFVARRLAERRHTRYDAELGWVNVANLRVPDMYGPGRSLTIDAQGFRGTRAPTPQVPLGKTRLVCSGDSFTLGYGVGDEQTWCHLLSVLDPRLETVNMGQGGYGVDQSYLWYMRDGRGLAHQAHLFAFITEDFNRMRHDRFLGYGKPVLDLEGDAIVVRNVPVPRRPFYFPWLTDRRTAISDLKTSELLRHLRGARAAATRGVAADERLRRLASRVFARLAQTSQERGVRVALVHLPTREDHHGVAADRWRPLLAAACERTGALCIDLIEPFRGLGPEEAEALFDLSASAYVAGSAHYNAQGHAFVARHVLDALRSGLPLAPLPTATAPGPAPRAAGS